MKFRYTFALSKYKSFKVMNTPKSTFDESNVITEIKKYLPSQAPLKDFIFQNQLSSFQEFNFFEGLGKASEIFGYKVFLSLQEFRNLYENEKISEDIIDKIIIENKGKDELKIWKNNLIHKHYNTSISPRVGKLRANWSKNYGIDLDSYVHTTLFRIICSYLDQGISIWNFPLWHNGFLASLKEMEQESMSSFFKTKEVKEMFLTDGYSIPELLNKLVGNELLYSQYLFDQQFAHPGWSGMVSVIEARPDTLIDQKITLQEIIILELLLEIDTLNAEFGVGNWVPLNKFITTPYHDMFADVVTGELHEVYKLWQTAYEWTFYDEVFAAIKAPKKPKEDVKVKSFQAMFCIDDREISLRDHLERTDPNCETYGTPGFFNVEFYFQPENGKSYTKLCPAPITPKYLIKEIGTHRRAKNKDWNFSKRTHSLLAGMIISPTLGLWSAMKLALSILHPSMTPATATSLRHMDKVSKLTIENTTSELENGLQLGFTIHEMADRVEGLLKSINLVDNFAPIVYVVGHGASSVNNPFYSTMDCGACSCRPGSVNARVFCHMANHKEVREILKNRGIVIPEVTHFLGGLHDTTRDEIVFYDEHLLSYSNLDNHFHRNFDIFNKALLLNAKERTRRFDTIPNTDSLESIHEKVLTRSVSLFEPRPELDHANNALTIVGRREITKQLFLDRRSFLNSYDYSSDPSGDILFGIMKPIAPVCGGINLNYYFSRVDNPKLGAGTKLPHNVMGLFGVANGIDGDLRPGLPLQMVEAHDPIRQMVVVEHYPEIVLEVLKKLPTYEWYYNQWMHSSALHPDTRDIYIFKEGYFYLYQTIQKNIETIADITPIIEQSKGLENIPVYLIS